jgi:hypothetical protein
MEPRIRRIDYFYTTVRDTPGAGYQLLARLAAGEVCLLAFHAVPMGPVYTRLAIYPESTESLIAFADRAGLVLDGPHHAILVQGDDHCGALVDVHRKLADAGVNVYMSSGVSDGRGYGYVIHLRPEELDRAEHALGV